MILVAILEAKHRLQHLPAGPVRRARPLEMPVMPGALLTDDRRVQTSERMERLAALSAKRRLDAHRRFFRALLPGKRQVQGAFAPVPGEASGTMEG